MKYIKKFDTISAQTEYLNSVDIDTYVGYVSENDTVYYDDALQKPYDEQYLTIESTSNNNTIYWKARPNRNLKTISASTDNGETWTAYTSTENGTAIATLNIGSKVLVKGTETDYSGDAMFDSTGSYEAKGNIMSLLYGDSFIGQTTLSGTYILSSIFYGSTGLTSAENLILPATTLADSCYSSMFNGCTSLTTAPELPAATIAEFSYYGMFKGCTSLNYIKCLATEASVGGTLNWVSGVASRGTFVKAASMNDWGFGDNAIPIGWTIQNE